MDLVHVISSWGTSPLSCKYPPIIQTPNLENIEQLNIMDAINKVIPMMS
jgi:hypothetical protein